MIKKAVSYLRDVRQEMSKVSWPTKSELIESTAIVLALSGVLAIYMFVADTGLSRILKLIF